MCLSLRQKKLIKTKHALAIAFANKLKTEKFDQISIKDVCAQTDVSEASFFNYFPQKIDVIAYLFKAKIFKTYWTIKPLQETLPFTECVEKTFALFVGEIKHPFIFFEMLSIIGTHKEQMASFTISPEELQCIYPDCADAEKIRMLTMHDFFEEMIEQAIEKKQIPSTLCKKNACPIFDDNINRSASVYSSFGFCKSNRNLSKTPFDPLENFSTMRFL